MTEVNFLYRSSLALGCLLLMAASIGCTGWFFYSWIGGAPGIVGAVVGCAVQIMAYGFSGVIVHQKNGPFRIILFLLITSALSLSVLSSYATLNGYFTALIERNHAEQTAVEQKEALINASVAKRLELMESMSRDVELGSAAADQGLGDKYRSQAKSFLEDNEATRREIIEQIEKIEALAQSDTLNTTDELPKASPISGLSGVIGGEGLTIMLLCIWLALMFDALPIVGLTLFEARKKYANTPADGSELHTEPESPTQSEIEKSLSIGQTPNASIEHSPTEYTAVPSDLVNQSSEVDMADAPIVIEPETHTEEALAEKLKIFTNLCSYDLDATRDFFTNLLGFKTKYDSDWYAQLCAPDDPENEFGVIQYNHDLVPNDYQRSPTGMYMTFVVEDVNEVYERAIELDLDIIQAPKDEFYGQRRFLVKEPSGCLVDISSPC